MTAAEIRERILTAVSRNGGHLASSLGAVELALAIRQVFDPYRDRIIWDVGHQAYAWKILTDRAAPFETLRQLDGLSGFPNPAESRADPAVAGHAGVALSVAEGLAAARDARGTDESVVAVVGDAAMANGTCLEALNNCLAATRKVIVVLNDNDMSISKPAGSISRFLGRLTAGVRYNRAKNVTKDTLARLHLNFLARGIHVLKSRVKSMFFANVFFEQFGLHYMGPVDGHDLRALTEALTAAKEEKRSVLVHVVTRKGKGFAPAEADPTKWHGVGPFAYPIPVDQAEVAAPVKDWSAAFGAALCDLAAQDKRVIALTAAMKDGTGLARFAERFPTRFFDVGIAEGHLMAFAAGLAAGGLRPVVAIYSTFLQRAIDQVMHDVALANLPVVFCVDRAGVVGADGATHQGVFDLAMLRCLPNLTVCQPKDEADLKLLLQEALGRSGPTVIRYPRGLCPASVAVPPPPSAARVALWATGDQLVKAQAVAARLVGAEVVFARFLKPFDGALLEKQRATGMKIVSLENGCVAGGFGEAINADLKFGWPDRFVPHGTVAALEKRFGFDVDSIVETIHRKFGE